MKCPVCSVSWSDQKGPVCPQCKTNVNEVNPSNTQDIIARREKFKENASAYDPESRVSKFDKMMPWLAVLLGFLLFAFWLRTCSTMGRNIF